MDRQIITTLINELYLRSLEAGDVLDKTPECPEEIEKIEVMISDLWNDLAKAIQEH
jgi:hypothetical protein